MATRTREERRRRTARMPAVWRGSEALAAGGQRAAVVHGARGRSYIGTRIFSAMILAGLLTVLTLFFTADAFYVRSIAVGGLHYLSKEEVFALSDIANTHLFWLDPQQIRESLLRSPTVADAAVQIGWPPEMVKIIIEERQPALVWEQAGVAAWVDLQGRVMRQREDRSDLIRIVADPVLDEPVGPQTRVNTAVVNGALQLQAMFPNIDAMRYNPAKGLGYHDGRGWVVWFGSGTDMPDKIVVYDAVVADLLRRGIQPEEINMVNPDAPYYSVLSE